jgi:hypothetical protein
MSIEFAPTISGAPVRRWKRYPAYRDSGAAFLDHETGCIDTLSTKIRESISKLREYRTALISAAVTGKIDVREGV